MIHLKPDVLEMPGSLDENVITDSFFVNIQLVKISHVNIYYAAILGNHA